MTYVWIVWCEDTESKFIAGVYDHKVRAEEDLRWGNEHDAGARYWIQEKEITK